MLYISPQTELSMIACVCVCACVCACCVCIQVSPLQSFADLISGQVAIPALNGKGLADYEIQ